MVCTSVGGGSDSVVVISMVVGSDVLLYSLEPGDFDLGNLTPVIAGSALMVGISMVGGSDVLMCFSEVVV